MPNPKKEIRFSIDTLFDMRFNNHVHDYFTFFEKLIDDDFILLFERGGEVLTQINDKNHLQNFKNSLNLV
ncbi:hypothetical protein LPB248_04385 [Flavobacterium sp. LPB0248]|nr:hypothetical protein LPB248_04385 [Flavobacterium sp. LPB0248]